MAMVFDAETTTLEFTGPVTELFDRAHVEGPIPLTFMFGYELCSLGGSEQALETEVLNAWNRLTRRRHAKILRQSLGILASRGVILPKTSGSAGEDSADAYTLSPELAVMLAARRNPAYALTTDVVGSALRCSQFFAVGDAETPVRGIVIEEPTAPSDATSRGSSNPKMAPLSWVSSYFPVSEPKAVEILTQTAIKARPGPHTYSPPYTFAISRLGYTAEEAGMTVTADGTTADVRVTSAPGAESEVYDGVAEEQLRTLIQRLFVPET